MVANCLLKSAVFTGTACLFKTTWVRCLKAQSHGTEDYRVTFHLSSEIGHQLISTEVITLQRSQGCQVSLHLMKISSCVWKEIQTYSLSPKRELQLRVTAAGLMRTCAQLPIGSGETGHKSWGNQASLALLPKRKLQWENMQMEKFIA